MVEFAGGEYDCDVTRLYPGSTINAEGVLDVIRQNIKENCPDVAFFIPEHHKWYQFGYGIMEA